MIILNPWRDSPLAPTTLVTSIGGITRLADGLIKCTFVQELPQASGALDYVACCHMIWPERRWLDAGDAFRWIMQEFTRGTFQHALPDDGGGRRPRTQ